MGRGHAHFLVRLVREGSDDHLSRLGLTTAVPPHRADRLSKHARLFRTRDDERRAARNHQVRERVELDILDAKDAIVRHRKGRGAEQAQEVDGEDPDLVLVLALEEDKLKESQGVLEVMTSACLGQPGQRTDPAVELFRFVTCPTARRQKPTPGQQVMQSRPRVAVPSAASP